MAEETWDMEITFKPYGASVAASIAAAKLPDIFSAVYLWGWPIIAVGSLADAINDSISPGSAITIEPPWIYYGGGRINAPTDAEWTATIPLQRTIGITSTVAAVQVS